MAKNVTNPNVVPAGSGVAPVVEEIPRPQIEEWKAPAAEEAAAVELPSNVDVQVMTGHPTRQIPVFNSKGKQTGWETVLDKGVQFAQPAQFLNKTAHHACIKGHTGKVLVHAETGVVLARFETRAVAEKHLKACGLSLDRLLAVTAKLRGRDIRQGLPAEPRKVA